MPYIIDPDDFTEPIDSRFASSAAEEFRKLKEKVTNLWSTAQINADDNTYLFEHGAYFVNNGASPNTQLGIVGQAIRTGGVGGVIGGWLSGKLDGGVEVGANLRAHGGYSIMHARPAAFGGVQGIEGHRIDVVQEQGSGQPWTKGLGIKFFNRAEGEDNVDAFGDDNYNKNAVAIFIESQAPSVAHSERIGWSRGIRFDDNALQEDGATGDFIEVACALDFAGLGAYRGPRQPVSFNFHGSQLLDYPALNSGAYVLPTTFAGVIEVTFDNAPNLRWGIPIIDLTPP